MADTVVQGRFRRKREPITDWINFNFTGYSEQWSAWFRVTKQQVKDELENELRGKSIDVIFKGMGEGTFDVTDVTSTTIHIAGTCSLG